MESEAKLSQELIKFLLDQQTKKTTEERNEKLKKILLLLAGGAALATAIAMPGTARLFRTFLPEKSDWEDWKMFNKKYLRQTIGRLAREKVVTIKEEKDYAIVEITEKGRKKVLQFAVESLTIEKPNRWDGKWRLVAYDIWSGRKVLRDRLQGILKGAGFYPLQESLYLHAYPCEQQIEFLRSYLDVEGEVRLIIAEKIENDSPFRTYFGV